ncbi:uncharacterized protein LOC114282476 [Camellia sinensis]|uniref:uncharacterized protein LOC114282476 n=1 Tax=Camellia sinensis TaxID=4442 RepID=UPI001036BD10|nr:uncharacterized protein LOC114282476 [Camellia sinensis]
MILLTWNIGGLEKAGKRRKMKEVLNERKVDMVFLQETKRAEISEELLWSLWPGVEMDFVVVALDGSSAGLLCIWKPSAFELSRCCCNRNFILLSGGDFNEIRNIGERKGCSRGERGMKNFNDFIYRMEVTELDMLGRKYIWCNVAEGEKWSKIDRFLLSPKWLLMFKFKVWGFPRRVSGHCLVVLMEDTRDWDPRSFRFINAWVLHPQFISIVKKAWEETVVSSWARYKIFPKLKAVKASLKQWNMEVSGDVNHKLKVSEDELYELDPIAKSRDLDDGELVRRRELREEVLKWSKRKEWLWLQKSRLSWTLNGDKNTKFFHSIASGRQNKNSLNSLTVNGNVIEDPVIIKEEVYRHFRCLFLETWKVRPKLGGVFKSIGSNDKVELEAAFSETEI